MQQSCILDGEDIIVLYGHLAISGLTRDAVTVKAGDTIGRLGAAHTPDTDGNRKHLHLGIHRGTKAVMLGYVQTEAELKDFIDPATVLPL